MFRLLAVGFIGDFISVIDRFKPQTSTAKLAALIKKKNPGLVLHSA